MIGRVCKDRKVFSLPVLMANHLTTLILDSRPGRSKARRDAVLRFQFSGEPKATARRPPGRRSRKVTLRTPRFIARRILPALCHYSVSTRRPAVAEASLFIRISGVLGFSGGNTRGATPVPIPNTAVNPAAADGSPSGGGGGGGGGSFGPGLPSGRPGPSWCAEHVRQLGGVSPPPNLMEVKGKRLARAAS